MKSKYKDYISGIRFRYIKPNNPILPIGFDRFAQRLRFGTFFEIINTKLPSGERKMKRNLRKACRIPKMSTFAIGALLNEGVSQMSENHVYVNIGVWHGFTFLSGLIDNQKKKCIGIDNFSEFGGPKDVFFERFKKCKSSNHLFYEMDYTDYFSTVHNEPIGLYMYDGSHNYKDQLKGLQMAEQFFSQDCIIVIDDTNYDEVRQAIEDFLAGSSCRYKTLLDKKTYCNCHPTFWNGIVVLKKVS
jgi:hypothetical protein